VHTLQRLSGILAALVAVIPVASAGAAESAAVSAAGVDRMIDLNRKAYADIQDQHFQAAKYRLSEALVISETEGLENHEMTARTYVHMAVVYLTGLKDREEAIQQFMLALHVNPNITITPGLESPALRSAYLEAREHLDLPPNPDTTAPVFPQAPSVPAPDATAVKMVAGSPPPLGESNGAAGMNEPDPPARVPSPLYCQMPFDTPSGQDVVVRCLTQKQQRKAEATFHYRPWGSEGEYVGLPMVRTPKGWLTIVVPGRAVEGKSLSYYVKATVPGQAATLHLGHPEAPNELIIRTPPPADGAEEATDDTDPVAGPTKIRTPDGGERPRPSQLRTPGSFWIALAGGSGAAYHGRETVDSNAKNPSTGTPVTVQAGFSAASIFQLEPELGYQFSKRLSVSVMGRYQHAPKDAVSYVPTAGEQAIRTSAWAGFVRGQFAVMSKGGFQTYASGGAGLGTSFLAVVNKRCGATTCSLNHTDTLHGGPVAVTAGVGAIYHLSPSFGVFIDIKEIVTLPKVLALTEINLGLTFAHKFKGTDGQKQARSTSRVSWR
jgi:hypothetical protein